ncbi:MAG: hypothetical protein MJZ41_11535 [Bacteroidaceae bacterium]|nr:hypothetical protein [Bacteroidaceae bacterium]
MMNSNNYTFDRKGHDGNLLFVGGDLSGIQKFLYNISSRKAAVSLKGRSFYLGDYMEKVLAQIISIPEIVKSGKYEVVYSSGGKFYLIIPDTQEIVSALTAETKQIKRDLWNKHKGELSINIAWTSFCFNEDGTVSTNSAKHEKIGVLWKELTGAFTLQKNQKFKDVILQDYADFFEVKQVSANTKICAITGIESNECVPLENEDGENGLFVLPSVREQIEQGKALRNIEHFKTFKEYADNSFLGILRMDVDGLGKRFINGFDSMDEYKTFSTRLDKFFDAELKAIRRKSLYVDNINIVYAGGDDLFAVGHWESLIEFAEEVRNAFVDYINDSSISISGGIAIVKPKFPIAKAAEMAGEAEDAAKHFRNDEKNAFNMFGESLSWKDEFAYVKKFKMEFVDLINIFGMSRGILHKLMLYATIEKKNKQREEENKNKDYSYIWHSTYYLTRYISRYNKSKEIKNFCMNLRDKELLKNDRNLELIAIAARWAELELRDNK